VRSADRAFVHGVNLAEVDVAVEKHLQLFVAWFAGDHARHRVAVFAEDPQSLCHALTASPGMLSRPGNPGFSAMLLHWIARWAAMRRLTLVCSGPLTKSLLDR
jgi:hypothetical protein